MFGKCIDMLYILMPMYVWNQMLIMPAYIDIDALICFALLSLLDDKRGCPHKSENHQQESVVVKVPMNGCTPFMNTAMTPPNAAKQPLSIQQFSDWWLKPILNL